MKITCALDDHKFSSAAGKLGVVLYGHVALQAWKRRCCYQRGLSGAVSLILLTGVGLTFNSACCRVADLAGHRDRSPERLDTLNSRWRSLSVIPKVLKGNHTGLNTYSGF